MKNLKNISEKIAGARKAKGWTQEELSQKSNLGLRTIQRLENGQTNPRAFTLRILEEILEIKLNDMETKTSEKEISKGWFIALHLTNILPLVVPAIILWALKRDEIADYDQHGKDVINFQATILLCMVICMITIVGFVLLPFWGIFSLVVTVFNIVKIIGNQPYKYPLTISFLK